MLTAAAAEYKAKWDVQAAELVECHGELKGTQAELSDMKVRKALHPLPTMPACAALHARTVLHALRR